MSRPAPNRAEELEKPAAFDDMGYVHTVVMGVPQPPFMRTAFLKEIQRDFSLRSDDIVIATYPKCGTTWMQQIVLLLLLEGDKSKCPKPQPQAPWIEALCCRKLLGLPENNQGRPMSARELSAWDGEVGALPAPPRRVFKTHSPAELVPWQGGLAGCHGAKVVLVTRNPKDACVSNFHHARDTEIFQYRGDFRHFVTQLFLPGRVGSGCFWAWHAGWERATAVHPGTVHWVSYEELHQDFEGTVRKLGQFLEVPVSDGLIAQVKEATGFTSMQKQFAEINKELEARGLSGKKNHIRRGEMGSWRLDINGALLNDFDAAHASKTAFYGLRYEFDFGDAKGSQL